MSALARFTSFGPEGRPRLARGRGLSLAIRTGLMALAAVALAAGGLEAAASFFAARRPAGQVLATAAMASSWTEVVRPIALYDLAGTDFVRLPRSYRARRHQDDGAREDVLTFGTFDDAKPYLQLSLLRRGADDEASAEGLADGLARLAGARGFTATRIRAAVPVYTRLGRIEAADLLLWDGGTAVPCLGFQGAPNGGTVLRVAGFACGAPGRPMGRAALACAIDRIDLVSAGDDALLRALFVAAERRGGSTCMAGAGGALLGGGPTGGRHLGWLDPDGDMPPLRGLLAVTNRQR